MTEASRSDHSLLVYYAVGIAIGCIIAYSLPKNEGEIERLKAAAIKEEERETFGKVKSELDKGSSSWDGDSIPKEELERIRKRFRMTPQQMTRVVALSKAEGTQDPKYSSLTPHQQLNRMVYLVMIMVLIYILNRDYGNVVLVWFVQIFPKEAEILGLVKSK
ncbi:unnamed protein product [Cylindrotheca closterium]|uniref:Uncharacterized protein n=1 Tax=Cylindrotheca closterium TaxID=2856 RepID=A0AAD2G2T4_9STRA|nr:unnamed protein product [Cylindrotheca closterium]